MSLINENRIRSCSQNLESAIAQRNVFDFAREQTRQTGSLRLRSVLVVPLRQRGAITGCIYVDHRLRGGAFDEAAATLLGELADIAAIAIENARLTDDLRRSTREVDELNRRLSAELAERDAELVRVKADLPDRSRLRNHFDSIVGRSPAICSGGTWKSEGAGLAM
jgi:GAF domain-containing protein